MYSNSEQTFQQPTQVIADFEEAPAATLRKGFQELKSLVTSQSATSATITQLLRYVERQWINKSTVFQTVCAG